MIVYGWNSFVLGKYKPSDIGLDANMDSEVVFERRQKYAHLFWIPFFGIGKIWVLRKKNDENQYKVNPDVEKVLEYKFPHHKTPWYTFALPLVAAVIGIIVYISSVTSSYFAEQAYEESQTKKVQEHLATLSNPTPDTYIEMDGQERNVYLKVLSHDANSITVVVSRPSEYISNDNDMLQAFIDDGTRFLDTAVISKADLEKTVNATRANDFEGFEVIPGEGKSTMSEVKRFPNPVFASIGGAYDNGVLRVLLRNIGASGKFKSLEWRDAKVELKSKFPDEIMPGDSLMLECAYTGSEPNANGTLILEAAQAPVQYDVRIFGSRITFNERK